MRRCGHLVVVLALLAGCRELPRPQLEAVVGRYRGAYAGAQDEFELRADGTFVQRMVTQGKVFDASGQWRIVDRNLEFEGALGPFDSLGNPVVPPRVFALLQGLWVSDGEWSRIAFNIDLDYAVDKVSAPPQGR